MKTASWDQRNDPSILLLLVVHRMEKRNSLWLSTCTRKRSLRLLPSASFCLWTILLAGRCHSFSSLQPPFLLKGKIPAARVSRSVPFHLHLAKPPFLLEEAQTTTTIDEEQDQENGNRNETLQQQPLDTTQEESEDDSGLLSRRQWLQQCAVLVGGGGVGATWMVHEKEKQKQEDLQKRKPFIRLEPHPHRRKLPPPKPEYNFNTTPAAPTTQPVVKNATAIGKNATSPATTKQATASAKPKTGGNNATATANKELAPVNFTKVASENSINITLNSCDGGCVRINGTSFQKIQDKTFPSWWPKFLQPAPKVLKDIPDKEVLLAATIAGSAIEMGRTLTLYPLSTVKTRIQTRQQQEQQKRKRRSMVRFQSSTSRLRVPARNNHNNTSRNSTKFQLFPPNNQLRQLRRRLRVLQLNVRRHVAEGNLYAGLVPSLLVSVPATGVYYGIRDVTKRMLAMAPGLALNDALITLVGAFVADVVSLMVRTPADALAARLQAVAVDSGGKSGSSSIKPGGNSNATVILETATTTNATATAGATPEADADSTLLLSKNATISASSPFHKTANITSIELAEEALFREEHYREKETTVVLNATNPIESLAAFILAEDTTERYLLRQLQIREICVQDLYGGGVGDEKNEKKQRSKKSAKCEAALVPHHLFTQEFLEGLKADASWNDISIVDITTNTIETEWDQPIWNWASFLLERMKLHNNETKAQEETGNWTDAMSMANETTFANTTSDAEIRMQEKEENQLLQELQEESIYQEDWLRQSLQRLPAIIITDLPYLLSRIALNRIIIHGTVNIGQYEVATIGIAVVCALITTPFDVVRTRLLVENNDQKIKTPCDIPGVANATTMVADGSILLVTPNITAIAPQEGNTNTDYLNQGVLRTMICIAKEGDGGVRNLYAGWLERTLYFGIGRAWIDPINIITYIGIRDTLLLKLFD